MERDSAILIVCRLVEDVRLGQTRVHENRAIVALSITSHVCSTVGERNLSESAEIISPYCLIYAAVGVNPSELFVV